MSFIKSFTYNEDGAVTVDWVVLTAAIVGIAMAVIALISSGVQNASNGVNDGLNSAGSLAASLFGGNDTVYGEESGFVPFGPATVDTYTNTIGLSEPDLQAAYNSAYTDATTNPDEFTVDQLAGAEQAMVERTLDIPEGNESALTLQTDMRDQQLI